jgi:hypothetical protein
MTEIVAVAVADNAHDHDGMIGGASVPIGGRGLAGCM